MDQTFHSSQIDKSSEIGQCCDNTRDTGVFDQFIQQFDPGAGFGLGSPFRENNPAAVPVKFDDFQRDRLLQIIFLLMTCKQMGTRNKTINLIPLDQKPALVAANYLQSDDFILLIEFANIYPIIFRL